MRHATVDVEGHSIFYREAGGFGQSAMPSVDEFAYSFDALTELTLGLLDKLGVRRFALDTQDYGAPIGLRIASRHPERVTTTRKTGSPMNPTSASCPTPRSISWTPATSPSRPTATRSPPH